jgi:D-alanine-D-alanine ligase-like ATP-grasp enzyme
MTHLTNDAIQNQGDQYGRYEKGNKLGYNQFQNYLDENYGSSGWKMSDLLKRMKQIAKRIAAAAYPIINAEHTTGFELFGMDFLIDASFKPWLLEVNTNPCLEQSSPLLQKLIPHVVENVLRLAVDPVFPPSVLPNK